MHPGYHNHTDDLAYVYTLSWGVKIIMPIHLDKIVKQHVFVVITATHEVNKLPDLRNLRKYLEEEKNVKCDGGINHCESMKCLEI